MKCSHQAALQLRIEQLQQQLLDMFRKKQSLVDPRVVALSQELDVVILKLQKSMRCLSLER